MEQVKELQLKVDRLTMISKLKDDIIRLLDEQNAHYKKILYKNNLL